FGTPNFPVSAFFQALARAEMDRLDRARFLPPVVACCAIDARSQARNPPPPPLADVRFTPQSRQIAALLVGLLCARTGREQVQQKLLLDHLVGECKHLVRNRQAKRLGGCEIDAEIELGWLLHRQVTTPTYPRKPERRCTPQFPVRIRLRLYSV